MRADGLSFLSESSCKPDLKKYHSKRLFATHQYKMSLFSSINKYRGRVTLVASLIICIAMVALMLGRTDGIPSSLYLDNASKEIGRLKTPVPVIGILTQVLRDYKRFTDTRHLHLVASYVKWVESSGAQAIPVLLNQNDDYYERIFNATNGLLFPGGDNLLDPQRRTPMMVAAKKLYGMAVDANDRGDYYPIWGTCLGFELLSVLTADKNLLTDCTAFDILLKMDFVARGKLFERSNYSDVPLAGADYSKSMIELMSKENLTYNYHQKCLVDKSMKRSSLDKFYRTLAYSTDVNGIKFISAFEAYHYPFFGVQFHPEKPPYEFVIKNHQHHIPHSRHAKAVSRYFADFFIAQAQKNGHQTTVENIRNDLAYAYQPTYTAPMKDMYEQRYLFPFDSNTTLSTEEFIDRPMSDDEVAPELRYHKY